MDCPRERFYHGSMAATTKDISQEARRQAELLCQGTVEVISKNELVKKLEMSLESGIPLRVKLGMDPSAPDLHLGHAVVLRKLRQFQDLGHQAILIVGDFTGAIGDPTGRNKTRPPLTAEEISTNAKTYSSQAGRVLDLDKVQIKKNSEWCRPLSFEDVIRMAGKITVARILERDDFQKRYQSGNPIGLHELFYPLIQAYDSVVLKADVELCGTDQKFNCLMGRAMQEADGQKPEVIMMTALLEGTDGKKKMSKSLGNSINFVDLPSDMFGKLMSLPDELLSQYMSLAAAWEESKVNQSLENIKKGDLHPMALKQDMASSVVELYWGSEKAQSARDEFGKVFSRKEDPEEMEDVVVEDPKITIVKLLVLSKLASSNSEARRMVKAGSVHLDGQKLRDPLEMLAIKGGEVLRAGRRKFVRIKVS